jgi:hypothetical protein
VRPRIKSNIYYKIIGTFDINYIRCYIAIVDSFIRLTYYLTKYFGISWLLYRLWYMVKNRAGITTRIHPVRRWDRIDVRMPKAHFQPAYENSDDQSRDLTYGHFFFDAKRVRSYSNVLQKLDGQKEVSPVNDWKDLKKGTFTYFSKVKVNAGVPPDWHNNYLSGIKAIGNLHWSRIGDFRTGDIKSIWELNRFAFTYSLVRAYLRTGNEEIPELFWMLAEDWFFQNPPNAGPNWKCGQEATFRVMAWCFALYGFQNAEKTTPERLQMLARMICFSGERIEANISYALSQKNNHSLSEAVGLWTAGLLFPEFKHGARWRRKGKKLIEKLTLELFNDEGAFTQNSLYYHRLALHDLIWAFLLGDINGEPFNTGVTQRFQKGVDFLYQLMDDSTGAVPNYGANDGSFILPLSNCDYRDFRPVIQSCYYYLENKRVLPDGPWDEDLLWLFGPEALNAPIERKDKSEMSLVKTGYYIFRSKNGFLFIRCGEHIFRPGQGDMLHVDIWWKGHNIAIDPGSYSYNAPPPWDGGLGLTRYHNTVTVDDKEQMDPYGKFLSFPWVKGKVIENRDEKENGFKYFEGTHDGYLRLEYPVKYRRGIVHIYDDYWIVIDKLTSDAPHTYRLHWLLYNFPYQWSPDNQMITMYPGDPEYRLYYGSMQEDFESSLVSADESSPRGWWSPYYYFKEPAISLNISVKGYVALFYTVLGPGDVRVLKKHESIGVTVDEREFIIKLNSHPDDGPVVVSVNRERDVSIERVSS